MAEINDIRAFRKGLLEMENRYRTLKAEIMQALGIKNRISLMQYADGKVSLDVVKAQAIEQIFHKYGITHPWGRPTRES
jgi:hypothetical protein